MFARLARFVVRHPWWTIVAWLVAAVLIIALSPKLTTESDQGDFLPSKYESVQALKIAEKAFPQQEDTSSLIVVKRSDGQPLTAQDSAKVNEAAKSLNAKKPPTVLGFATGPQAVAPNKAVQVVMVPMKGTSMDDSKKQGEAVKQIRKDLPTLLKGSGMEAKVGGDVAGFVDNEDSFNKSFEIVGIATFVLIIGLILLIFRAPLAAILPIIVITVTMQVAMGLIGTASKIFGFSGDDSLSTIILIVLFGIGADYYLFLMFRFRERLRAGDDKKTAMITAVERVGEVISSAAAAIAVTFLVLLLATFGVFSAWGPSLAIAVVVMGITSLTLFPALVSLLGTAVFWPSKAWKKQPKDRFSTAIGRGVGKRPAVAAAASGLVLVVLALGTLGFKADYDFAAGFPQDTESAQATKDMEKGFPPGLTTPVQVFIKSQNGQPVSQQQLQTFSKAVENAPGVGRVQPPVPGQDKTVARVDLVLKLNPASNKAISLVKDDLAPAVHKAAPEGTRAYVGGPTAIFSDINAVNNRDLSVILPVAAVLIALILALLLRSVVAPLYLVVAVLLGFAATLGSAVYVFQGAMGEAGVTFQLPIVLYLFVLAIGTDYNILMTARLREEAKEGHEPRKAAALAVQHGGPTVAAAGLILAGTFSVMMLAPVSMLQQMGFSVAIGIALSAFVMSTFLVPGLTAMLGHRAWWPGHGDEPKKQPRPNDTREDFAPTGHRG
ncbi:RND superfamily putative drug exporter [Actinomadura coerulea]|uniref:RND superfamily putative drug exporter n=1 Tax=Actinomadura coerulea TaxID=46159 RepID=A0A7X0G7F9_9ACTN|nr:MMPL family transporter [Actinomadura coerulea]MBB6400087.1 RND superfamily putative drug exporter [Actinomadura coerulea]GGQ21942.1 membrane protein [Actinomadura coerulea]